ncbi:Hypothetical protein CINCED_3A010701 [Cinara cedri]|uniref:Uncharacterized protein n=1 Tax=Cinara cedri TaxID=506608 RepID=A0A5E4NGD7_9HEMI|nr:Hypothetical protein CINCED_3A010701 [Cinara cedri]
MESIDGEKTRKTNLWKPFLNMIKREGYKKYYIYNDDETNINWKELPRKSLASRCESLAPSYKISKDRITAMVLRKC